MAALAAVFACFTWRGLTMFFSDDDVMNMYKAWITPAGDILKGLLLPWSPVLRPAGTAVYRIFYELFGFRPLPLYAFCWLLLIANVCVAWRFFRALASPFVAVTAIALTLVHGTFQDLYLSAGTIYDQLCFLFTALAITVYAKGGRWSGIWTCVFCLLAIDSKESGAAVPAILVLYECVYDRKALTLRRIRSLAPLYGVLMGIVAALVFWRIPRTPDLAGTAAYYPHLDFSVWLTHLAAYFSLLTYQRVTFSPVSACIVLAAMAALAILLRNRAMTFGWLFFVISVTPVALIEQRAGYVLYLPLLGLGLWAASLVPLISLTDGDGFSVRQATAAGAVAIVALAIHAMLWPAAAEVRESPEWRLSRAMLHSYPSMKPGARILFADDFPTDNGYDSLFNLRLLYHDSQIEVARLKGSPEQQPDGGTYDHVFTTIWDTYAELDRKHPAESLRLNILRDYAVALEFDTQQGDCVAYTVSGFWPAARPGDGWWTARSASLKFQPPPAGSTLLMTYFVPEYVAASPRTLSVTVGDMVAGSVMLNHAGENKAEFPVPPGTQTDFGYIIVRLDVDHPYMKDGREYGVVLVRAGFRATP